MKFYKWAVLLAFLFYQTVNAQTVNTDSLLNLLQAHPQEDTIRVKLLNEFSFSSFQKDSSLSIEYGKKALEISKKLNDLKGQAFSYYVIGRSFAFNISEKKALDYYLKAIELAEKTGDQASVSKYLNSCGSSYSAIGDINNAQKCYERSLDIEEKLKNHRLIMGRLINLSIIYTGQGNYEKALKQYQKVVDMLDQKDDKVVRATVYNNLGEIYNYQGNYTQALEFYHKSQKIKQEINDQAGYAFCLINISSVYTAQLDYQQALEYLNEALKIANKVQKKRLFIFCYQEIGNVYMLQGRSDALDYLLKALEIGEGLSYQTAILNLSSKIGDYYFFRKNYSEALTYYSRALKISEEVKRKRTICETSLKIGQLYLQQKEYEKALTYTQQGLALANEVQLLANKKDAYQQLSEIYAGTHRFDMAYRYHTEYKTLNDSIFNEKNVKKIAEIEYNYKLEKEKQILEIEQKRKNEVQKSIIISLITGLILLFLFSAYVFRSNRIKHRINLVLRQQKEEIEKLNEELIASNNALVVAKKMVEESEEKLKLLIKNSTDILILQNENAQYTFVSNAAQNLTGYSMEELLGHTEEMIVEEDRELISQHWQRVINRPDVPDTIQYRHKHKTNGFVWFEAVTQNFLHHPAIKNVVSNVRDITERKKAEIALQESEAAKAKLLKYEIERINNELEINQKSMTATTLKLIQNSERDAQMINLLSEIEKGCSSEARQKIKILISDHKRFASNSNWNEFEILFEKVHHSFYEKLQTQFPNLTPNERRICAFLKLNMSNKDIAQITFQSEEALKKARLRLRQKLEIDRETNLGAFLQSI